MKFRFCDSTRWCAPRIAATLALSLIATGAAYAAEAKPAAEVVVPPVLEETVELRVLDAATVVKWLDVSAPGTDPNQSFNLLNPYKPDVRSFTGLPLEHNDTDTTCGGPRFQSSEPDPNFNPYRFRYYPNPYPYPNTVLSRPIGLGSVTAIEGRNAVRVRGTQEFLDAVRRNVEPLDKPSQTIVFDVVCYKVPTLGGKKEKLLYPDIPLGATGSSELIRERIATFEGMIKDAKAQRFDLLPRIVQSGQMACVGFVQLMLLPPAWLNNANNNVVSYVSVPVRYWQGFQVTPTLNGDGTIKLSVVPAQTNLEPTVAPPEIKTEAAQTIAAVREGETLLWELKKEPSAFAGRFRWFLAATPRVAREPKIAETPILKDK